MVDTHCHIFSPTYMQENPDQVIKRAQDAGVKQLICVGTSVDESKLAVEFAKGRDAIYPTIGIHPHEAKDDLVRWDEFARLLEGGEVVAIGECGLDYWYELSDRDSQKKAFKAQIDLALEHNLPMIFHIRNSRSSHEKIMNGSHRIGDAFADFIAIIESYKAPPQGVVHSFSTGQNELNAVLLHGFSVGVNGIVTFTRDEVQLEAYRNMPLKRLVLETDAPYLTPAPRRGETNEPARLVEIVDFLAELRSESATNIAQRTTLNAQKLFNLGEASGQ